ncbi:DUF4190 domain-containing protein [Clostridium transplantifaecale]|uniref:DUF4190 domain-containing protein n=1 Tax=Clostridium transplantifaecale TaxID=2479838 RepID=UPI000F644B3B|nr:DUF4190 domain-containing protein [Clostridium transplantifaecale]
MDYYDSNDNQYNNGPENGRNQGGKPAGGPPKQPNGMATVSLICGIIGVLSLCACIAFPLSIILGVAAIVLSFLSRKGEPFTGMAIAGLVLGILALVLGVAEGLYMIAVNFMLRDPQMSSMFDQILDQYQNAQ